MVTPKVEEYLKVIHRLQDGDQPVTTSAVATAMGVKPPTVTKMLQRMATADLVEYERYEGTVLTPTGERRALEVLRHHRLLELFLTEELDYGWDEVHAEADVLEHYISEKLETRIAARLGDPTHDPHGDPIPTVDLELNVVDDRESLATCREGDVVTVDGVRESSPGLLSYLGEAGVTLGTTIEVREVAPIGLLSVVLSESGEQLALPVDAAEHVYVSHLQDPTVDDDRQFNEVY